MSGPSVGPGKWRGLSHERGKDLGNGSLSKEKKGMKEPGCKPGGTVRISVVGCLRWVLHRQAL